ncbi:hypothetical protein BUY85_00540 [Staphylococcus equorum]|uniref:hypothetical protein n=1 Tax=Staphylococcus equorum TaxID=246432 RepID=UPI000D1C7D49|nr:hypothetical protein [Staphylococcus equorum]PTE82257.1 hypothetical protein BUY85_00540 [Staphylococcus equorum]
MTDKSTGNDTKLNKTYQLVKALKEDGELYTRYINRELSMKDISEMFGVSYQHVANIVKENNIGNPKVERQMIKDNEKIQVENDINNGLPIDYFKENYTMFNPIKTTMSMFNSLNTRIKNKEIKAKIPLITIHRLNILVLEVNIMKFIKNNAKQSKGKKKRISDIAEIFGVSYTKVAYISSYFKKEKKNLLPNKDEKLVKIVMRNLDITKEVIQSDLGASEAIKKVAEDYDIEESMVSRIVECEPYIEGADIEEFIKINKERTIE